MTLYSHISDALENDINIKRLLLAAGVPEKEFFQRLEDNTFSCEQEENIRKELKEWKQMQE